MIKKWRTYRCSSLVTDDRKWHVTTFDDQIFQRVICTFKLHAHAFQYNCCPTVCPSVSLYDKLQWWHNSYIGIGVISCRGSYWLCCWLPSWRNESMQVRCFISSYLMQCQSYCGQWLFSPRGGLCRMVLWVNKLFQVEHDGTSLHLLQSSSRQWCYCCMFTLLYQPDRKWEFKHSIVLEIKSNIDDRIWPATLKQ